MTDLAAEITAYVRGERAAMERGRLVAYIVADAAANPAWTKATYQQWESAIDEAVGRGLLLVEGKIVRMAPQVAVTKTEQLELF